MFSSAAKRKSILVVLLVFVTALLVRIPLLGRTALWGDEILFVNIMANIELSPWQVFLNYWDICVGMAQLPLAGVVMNTYLQVVDGFVSNVAHHVLALRIPGAIAGALAVAGGYWLGRRWVRREINWVATAMAMFFFFPVYYSREVYCYPYVMLFAAFSFLFFNKGLFDETPTWRTYLALFLWAAGLGLCHFGCSVALAAMAVVSGGWWVWNVCRNRSPETARKAAWTAGACVLAGGVVAPYWVRILTANNVHVASEAPYSLFRILNDVVSKFFLGDRLIPALLAWLLLLVGLISLWRRPAHPTASRMAVGLFVLIAIVLTILAQNSQYVSSRYFAMLVPVVYFVFAEGLWVVSCAIARWFRRDFATQRIYYSLAMVVVLIHAGLFLPELFRAPEKGYPHASSAQWLNENAVPGSPYFYDSGGFDMRYIPGYYPTPELTPAGLFAWNDPGYTVAVHDFQRHLMQQFPISYYLRSPIDPWPEAEKFYKSRDEYRNPQIMNLRRYGIFPDVNTDNLQAESRDILFNTREDAIALAKEAGLSIYVEYPGFQCAEIDQEVYGRIRAGRKAELVVLNLRDAPIQGVFRITGAIAAVNQESAVNFTLPSGEQVAATLPSQDVWTVETPPCRLPEGTSRLLWEVDNFMADEILFMGVEFVEQNE